MAIGAGLERNFAIRVDIDTVKGLVDGVPRVLDLCEDLGIRTTFFSCVGRDTAARAFLRSPRIARHAAVNPLRKYGLGEILGSLKGLRFADHTDIFRRIKDSDHEIQLHGYDHVEWVNHIRECDAEGTERMISRGIEEFERILGSRPQAFASPAFEVTSHVLKAEEKLGFLYAGDYRVEGDCIPFRPGDSGVLQIPVNAPLIEDLVARGLSDGEIINLLADLVRNNSLTVIYIHACYEPRVQRDLLRNVVSRCMEEAESLTLGEVFRSWSPSE
jgi:uncharacterized protein YoaH (UPF0181 family)